MVHSGGGGDDREEVSSARPRSRARGPAEEEEEVPNDTQPVPQESGEAEFLRKDVEQEKSAPKDKDKAANLPPPEDNFSSGLF